MLWVGTRGLCACSILPARLCSLPVQGARARLPYVAVPALPPG